MQDNETIFSVLNEAEKALRKGFAGLLAAGAPSSLLMHFGAALNTVEHAPCLLAEACKHEDGIRPEIQVIYSESRDLFRQQVIAKLCQNGATADELLVAFKALLMLELHGFKEHSRMIQALKSAGHDDDDRDDEDDFKFDDQSTAENLAERFTAKDLAAALQLVLESDDFDED